jgi:predicted DNA-binding protein (UPF0251 family)
LCCPKSRLRSDGDKLAPERLIPLVYDELRRLANVKMKRERPEHTLQPTALVRLRFFAGMSVDETAQVLGVHPDTVARDWKVAKAFLHSELSKE